MTKDELVAYKSEIEKMGKDMTVLKATREHFMKNCGNTGDRMAPKGKSWIDYWRAVTGYYSTTMYCSSCGKEIFVGLPSFSKYLKFSNEDDSVEKHRAHGGHVWVVAEDRAKFSGGRYITPLCPHCNGQHDKDVPIKKGAVFCKEIGATIED